MSLEIQLDSIFSRNLLKVYILEGRPQDTLSKIPSILKSKFGKIEVVTISTVNKNYVIEDFDIFFKDLGHKSMLEKRIFIIEHAEKLTPVVSNMLLRPLEDLDNETTVIILAEKGTNLLPTVESRATRFILSDEQHQKEEKIPASFTRFLNNEIDLQKLAELNKSNHENLEKIEKYCLQNASIQNFKDTVQFEQILKSYETARAFNLPLTTRLFKLTQMLKITKN